MAVSDDKGPVGSSRRHAEASVGRIGDDVQRAKENISGAAASARDDITTDLHRLSADVASLRDTIAALAKRNAGGVFSELPVNDGAGSTLDPSVDFVSIRRVAVLNKIGPLVV